MSKHNFQETLDNESDLRKTLGYNKVYNDLKNNFLVLKMHQNAPQSMQIFKIFWGWPPIPPLQEGEPPPAPSPRAALPPGAAVAAQWCSGYFKISS